MINEQELEARKKYGMTAYSIISGGGLKFRAKHGSEMNNKMERAQSEIKSVVYKEPPREKPEEKHAAAGYVCPDCGAIAFMPVESCDICKSKKRSRKKTAPKVVRIMSETEREKRKVLMNRMNDAILRESLKVLPAEWSDERKAEWRGKLTRLKIKHQELRRQLENDLLARIERDEKV